MSILGTETSSLQGLCVCVCVYNSIHMNGPKRRCAYADVTLGKTLHSMSQAQLFFLYHMSLASRNLALVRGVCAQRHWWSIGTWPRPGPTISTLYCQSGLFCYKSEWFQAMIVKKEKMWPVCRIAASGVLFSMWRQRHLSDMKLQCGKSAQHKGKSCEKSDINKQTKISDTSF